MVLGVHIFYTMTHMMKHSIKIIDGVDIKMSVALEDGICRFVLTNLVGGV